MDRNTNRTGYTHQQHRGINERLSDSQIIDERETITATAMMEH